MLSCLYLPHLLSFEAADEGFLPALPKDLWSRIRVSTLGILAIKLRWMGEARVQCPDASSEPRNTK
jgi:hypothetical protein